ncbi:heptaprenyl diphosphate synthase component 1 [Alteribacillus sp. YIM 98480]|uniref:heptaprenyl diphosphate synthase component 1 n=1 Tax=Alteribacillus sp. YIM 98480 TaxID=2606599 RepID=UPI00131DA065|nr:heptaprenyl diphosphate synthase component 1 [Alteribacillus sp. YIM 98480]
MIQSQQQAEEVKNIEDQFLKMTTHPYLKKHIDSAEIEYDIIFFLLEIMKETSLTQEEKREQILSALLVQAAFLTHEKVHNTTLEDSNEKKPRQLTVLAGDFFSSLYYFMLVKNVHDDILPVFSSSIQKINVEKMSLHFSEHQSEGELMKRLKTVEGGFIADIAFFYKKDELAFLAEKFFLLKRLFKEKEKANSKYLSAFASAIHSFSEGYRADEVTNWPPVRTSSFLNDKISELQVKLQNQLDTYPAIHKVPLYNRLNNWTNLEFEAKIK